MGFPHRTSLEIVGDADVVVWPQHETRALAGQPVADGLDFLDRRFLFGEQMIESKDEEGIGIRQHAFIEWQPVAGLVDALKHWYRMARDLGDERLERHPRAKEQLQRAGDALLKHRWIRPLRSLPEGPFDAPYFRHRRESIVEIANVAIGLTGEAPAHIDADAPSSVGEFPALMDLVVRARRRLCVSGRDVDLCFSHG